MCLIALAWRCHPFYDAVLATNRDEFHPRPAAPAQVWGAGSGLVGGRDLEKGGSWLLASDAGRFVAVTNVRVGRAPESAPRSRGALVDGFARSDLPVADYLRQLAPQAAEYGRFNVLLGADGELMFASNHPQFRQQRLAPGVHALSNGDLDAPWPKTERLRAALTQWLGSPASLGDAPDFSPLWNALADPRKAGDADLPDTGVGIDLERHLSSPFIVGDTYGTRASSLLLVRGGQARLLERRFGPNGVPSGGSDLRFAWP
jgi:uncharacterized protein with NRDE domain